MCLSVLTEKPKKYISILQALRFLLKWWERLLHSSLNCVLRSIFKLLVIVIKQIRNSIFLLSENLLSSIFQFAGSLFVILPLPLGREARFIGWGVLSTTVSPFIFTSISIYAHCIALHSQVPPLFYIFVKNPCFEKKNSIQPQQIVVVPANPGP